jgi:uncharacterized membrane protein YfcA
MISGYSAAPGVVLMVIGAACFLTGVSKGGLGGTMGVLITPLAAMVLPMDKGLGLALLMFMLGDVFALAVHWRRWESRLVWILLAGGLAGVTMGTFVLTSVSQLVLRKGLGVFVLLFIIYRLSERFISKEIIPREPEDTGAEGRMAIGPYRTARMWPGLLAGSAAGFTSTLAHSGGPAIVAYLLTQRLEPAVFVATSVLFFAVLNWIKVPYYYYAGMFDFGLALRLAWLAPLVPLGVWVGKRLVKRIDRRWFEGIITALLLAAGVLLLVK